MDRSKKIFVFLFLSLFVTFVHAESISDLNTNSPVPLDTDLVIRGLYNNPGPTADVNCEFIALDPSRGNAPIDKIGSDVTFSDGSFYVQKKIMEPQYFRGFTYIVEVTCGGVSADTNFTVDQRLGVDKQFFGELIFVKDNPYLWIEVLIGLLVIVLIGAFVRQHILHR